MSSAVRRLAQQAPRLTKGFANSASANGGSVKPYSHEQITLGDGHHGLRPGYTYDYEHGPHYMQPRKIPNFMWKWNVGMKAMMATAVAIPCFAVWWQQSKAGGA